MAKIQCGCTAMNFKSMEALRLADHAADYAKRIHGFESDRLASNCINTALDSSPKVHDSTFWHLFFAMILSWTMKETEHDAGIRSPAFKRLQVALVKKLTQQIFSNVLYLRAIRFAGLIAKAAATSRHAPMPTEFLSTLSKRADSWTELARTGMDAIRETRTRIDDSHERFTRVSDNFFALVARETAECERSLETGHAEALRQCDDLLELSSKADAHATALEEIDVVDRDAIDSAFDAGLVCTLNASDKTVHVDDMERVLYDQRR